MLLDPACTTQPQPHTPHLSRHQPRYPLGPAQAREIERICCATMAEFTPGMKIAVEYTLSDCWSKGAEVVVRERVLRVWTPVPHICEKSEKSQAGNGGQSLPILQIAEAGLEPVSKTLSKLAKRRKAAQIWLNLSGFWSSQYASQRPGSLMSRSLASSKQPNGRQWS